MAKLKLTFKIFGNEKQAKALCDEENARYPWRKNKAHYTPWNNANNTEHGFVAFYYY